MAFADTQPARINHGDTAGDWARFRIRSVSKQLAALRDLCRNDTPLVIGMPGGATLQVALWSVDDVGGRLHFRIDSGAQALNDLSYEPELWAAAYVDDDKLQFALTRLKFGVDKGLQVLAADIPRHMYRLPRRQAVRVRRNDLDGPKARLAHPLAPAVVATLKLLDVSSTGCALLSPPGGPLLSLGMLLKQVEVELDDDTILFCDLVVQHITAHSRRDCSARVGCAWQGMPVAAQERLREWIGRGRRRRNLISLNLG
jgi:c-di-GMP-binding flagellar brake protein YcgR